MLWPSWMRLHLLGAQSGHKQPEKAPPRDSGGLLEREKGFERSRAVNPT